LIATSKVLREWADMLAGHEVISTGLLDQLATKHICIALANKLFDYMGARLPVLASDVPPMRRVLSGTGAGLLAPPSDVEALAHGFTPLLCDPALRRHGRL
jgi:glycosyltransferase involved in cell wall biosynthesis